MCILCNGKKLYLPYTSHESGEKLMCIGSSRILNLAIWDEYSVFDYAFYIVWYIVHNVAAFCLLDRNPISLNRTIIDDPIYVHFINHHNIHTHITATINTFVSSELPCTNSFCQVRVAAQYLLSTFTNSCFKFKTDELRLFIAQERVW